MKALIATLILGLTAAASAVSAAEFTNAELEELGQSYTRAINELDVDALNELLSARHLATKIAETAGDTDAEKQRLTRIYIDTIPKINERLVQELRRQGSKAIFLRVHEFDGMRGPLIRYNVGDGYNYTLLLPVRPTRAGSEVRAGDLYYATSGELLSESIGIATKLAAAPSETFLGKLFGVKDVKQDLVARFKKIGEFRQQNRLQEAYDVFDQMEGPVRNHRIIMMSTIQLASQISEELYLQELRRLAQHHKDDPRVAFTLLDHYFFEGDYDAAMSTIDVMEESYGSDGVIYIFRANVDSGRNRIDSALGYARKAVGFEPDNEMAQWTLVTVLLQSEKYAEVVDVLQLLESKFGYTFTRENFEEEPLYAEFLKTDEFAGWIGGTKATSNFLQKPYSAFSLGPLEHPARRG